jgi:hypothetical protein
MMRVAMVGGLIVLAIVASMTASRAAPAAPANVEDCARLLPKGKSYTYEANGKIDTSGTKPKVSFEMSVSDGSQEDRQAEGKAFGQCLAKLFKSMP